MDLATIKEKFKHKTTVDLKDIDIALRAVPILIKELARLESKLEESKKRIEHLASLTKKRPPLEKNGKRGDTSWESKVDEEQNRLYIKFIGKYDYKTAKFASNGIITILPNLRDAFDVVINILEMNPTINKRTQFQMRKFLYHLERIGIARVICIGKSDTREISGLFIADLKVAGCQVNVVDSVEKAENILESVKSFLKA